MLHIGILLKTVKVVILCLGKYSKLWNNLLPQTKFLEKTKLYDTPDNSGPLKEINM
jgi:hypothetical protein